MTKRIKLILIPVAIMLGLLPFIMILSSVGYLAYTGALEPTRSDRDRIDTYIEKLFPVLTKYKVSLVRADGCGSKINFKSQAKPQFEPFKDYFAFDKADCIAGHPNQNLTPDQENILNQINTAMRESKVSSAAIDVFKPDTQEATPICWLCSSVYYSPAQVPVSHTSERVFTPVKGMEGWYTYLEDWP